MQVRATAMACTPARDAAAPAAVRFKVRGATRRRPLPAPGQGEALRADRRRGRRLRAEQVGGRPWRSGLPAIPLLCCSRFQLEVEGLRQKKPADW